jgi:hypothetical protein
VPNQHGRNITNPTLKWAFQLLQQIVRVTVKCGDQIVEEVKGVDDAQRKYRRY